jgi:hypothetical protein
MIELVLTLILAQGVPAISEGASVSGGPQTETGTPAGGVRSAPNRIQIVVPVVVTVEGGGSLPTGAAGSGIPTVKLVPLAGGPNLETQLLDRRGITIPVTVSTEEYRVSVENLPPGYTVKSMTFGSTNLSTDTLKASIALSVTAPRIGTYTGEGELQRLIDEILERRSGANVLSVTLVKS